MKSIHDPVESSLDGGGADLENEVLPVAVHDEARNAVGLGVEEAIGVAIYPQRLAVSEGLPDPSSEPGLVHGLVAALSYAKRDLAPRVVEALPEEVSSSVEDEHHIARLSAGLGDVGAVDPGVPRAGAGGAPVPENDPRPIQERCKLLYPCSL